MLAQVAPLVTWLGQAGFRFEAGGRRILIDPFLDDDFAGRLYPPPAVDGVAAGVDWLLVTHEHLDHLDPVGVPLIAERSPGMTIVAPEPLREQVGALAPGVAFTGVRPGDPLELPGAGTLRTVPAIHAVEVADGYSDGARAGGPPRFVGFVLELDGVAIYHAGDTIVTAELVAALRGLQVDVALLPVNGRTYFRERADLVGNMGFRDAVALAADIGATTLVPVHWDLFAQNSERPGAAADEAWATDAALHVLVLRRGLPWAAAPAPRPAAP
jgi:L-ascorbate metabolism protein UlaG (beta-lactamase superfamily)